MRAALLDLELAVLGRNHALRSASDFGNFLWAKLVDEHLQRRIGNLDVAQRPEQGVTSRDRLAAFQRLALCVVGHAQPIIAVLVGVAFHLQGRERLAHVADELVARRQVEFFLEDVAVGSLPRVALAVAQLGERPVLIGRVGIGDLQQHRVAGVEVGADLPQHTRHLRRGDDLVEKALMRAPEL